MNRSTYEESIPQFNEKIKEQKIQENMANWQSGNSPLTGLSETHLDVIYHITDFIEEQYYRSSEDLNPKTNGYSNKTNNMGMPIINTNKDYIKWLVQAENEIKLPNLNDCLLYFDKLQMYSWECNHLFKNTEKTLDAIKNLQRECLEVTAKTDSLHSLSEELIKYQKNLKNKRVSINNRLQYFRLFHTLSEYINNFDINVNNNNVFLETLDKIDESIKYLHDHPSFKESKLYNIEFESLLSKAVMLIRKYFKDIIVNTTKQVTDSNNKTNLLNSEEPPTKHIIRESSFGLYYGKFQSIAVKIKSIINHIENKVDKHECYRHLLLDCQQIYFVQRSPIMTDAVGKALLELKSRHKDDYSVLFRSAGLFLMQVCQDETACFNYFFTGFSPQLSDYLGILCQNLYDMLRPCLISIYHLEILTELCSILRREMLGDQMQNNEALDKFTEIIKQLLQDVEERLVFRTHIYFHNDLELYRPSPGDLAYPEKLEHMENIAEEIIENRPGSRSSIVSMESQEVANITNSRLGQFRSYTGNSPADLHGMWYPTVKRTLVCLSRLYFCLDREIFQGLAQEALSICVETISKAATEIANRKTQVDARLFQIKHLLILREQIAPFQVDFTIVEVALDFSNIKTAAVSLIQNRDKLFTFSTNNALLEFLLEGTPKVKEYLIDSRKEIDKQLKASCELFISYVTLLLIGNMLQWVQKAENCLNVSKTHQETVIPLKEQEFAKPHVLAGIISVAQRNIKTKIPEIQRSMQLYLANRETEVILFRPIKNGIVNIFTQIERILSVAKYNSEDQLIIGCPTPEQINILLCSVSLTAEQDHYFGGANSKTSCVSASQYFRKKSIDSEASSVH